MKNKNDFKTLLEKALGTPSKLKMTVTNPAHCYSNDETKEIFHDLWVFLSNGNEHLIVTTVKVAEEPNELIFATIEIPDAGIVFSFNAKDGYTNAYRYTLNDYLKVVLERFGVLEDVVRIVATVCDGCDKYML